MALVTIVIADDGDEDVEVKLFSEPPLPIRHPEDATNAHVLGMEMLNAAGRSGEIKNVKAV